MPTISNLLSAMLGNIPKKDPKSQKLYEDLGNKFLEKLPKEEKYTEYFSEGEDDRRNLLKLLQHHKRIGKQRGLDIAIRRKEEEPYTRNFTQQELKTKYIPAHERRGKKFSIKKEREARRLDAIFDSFDEYRESSMFKNFKGDTTPELTKKEYSDVIKNLKEELKAYGKSPKIYTTLDKEFTDDYLNSLVKSKKRLYPEENFENVTLTPQQTETLRKFLLTRGRKIYKDPTTVESQRLKDAINRAEFIKYEQKSKPLKSDSEYDGYTFKDFYDSIEYD